MTFASSTNRWRETLCQRLQRRLGIVSWSNHSSAGFNLSGFHTLDPTEDCGVLIPAPAFGHHCLKITVLLVENDGAGLARETKALFNALYGLLEIRRRGFFTLGRIERYGKQKLFASRTLANRMGFMQPINLRHLL